MTSRKAPITVTITGAGGQIGYATMFRVAAGEMLGADQPVRLKLLEIERGVKSAEGAAMELMDCAFPLLESVEVTTSAVDGFDGSSLGLLIGASPRLKGMERGDLLQANGGIFSVQGQAINAAAADDFRAVVVGNPANTNALIAASHAPDVPLERFTALTRLDHNRAVAQLAEATQSAVADISGIAIWGNHSATQYPDLTRALIAGMPAREVLAAQGLGQEWVDSYFIPKVAKRGAEIIEVRGGSSIASAANATIEHIKWWLGSDAKPTSMAVASDGSYGVPEGIICSFPVICSNGKYEIIHNLDLEEDSQERINRSVQELLEEKAAVRELGLLGDR